MVPLSVWLAAKITLCPDFLGPACGFKVETWGAHELIYNVEMGIPSAFRQSACCPDLRQALCSAMAATTARNAQDSAGILEAPTCPARFNAAPWWGPTMDCSRLPLHPAELASVSPRTVPIHIKHHASVRVNSASFHQCQRGTAIVHSIQCSCTFPPPLWPRLSDGLQKLQVRRKSSSQWKEKQQNRAAAAQACDLPTVPAPYQSVPT